MRLIHQIALTGCFLCVATRPAAATLVRHHYDLDSLVYLSRVVVRGTIEGVEEFKAVDNIQKAYSVRIEACLRGALQSDQVIKVAGLEPYFVPPMELNPNWRPLAKGDRLYLFLVPTDGTTYWSQKTTIADWRIIESGVRVVVDPHVYSFKQTFGWRNEHMPLGAGVMGNYSVMTRAVFGDERTWLRPTFERMIGRSQHWLDENAALVEGPARQDWLDRYLAIYRRCAEKIRAEMAMESEVAVHIASHIAMVADPKTVDQLSRERSSGMMASRVLERCFASHRGRAYLLERVVDPSEDKLRRLSYLRVLSDAGRQYACDAEDFAHGKLQSLDTDFATRLAHLAAENLESDLGSNALDGIEETLQYSGPSNRPEALKRDLIGAATVLSKARSGASTPMRVRIGKILESIGSSPLSVPAVK